ncbi:MAG: hypothetical protein JXB88_16390 [Spirochaetales bacterium]|nr:hypothetical protein [Spirochaetales bacterium]
MAKKKRITGIMKKINAEVSRENFREVIEKNKIENPFDLYKLYKGLSANARERAALSYMYILHLHGKSPQQIVDELKSGHPVQNALNNSGKCTQIT